MPNLIDSITRIIMVFAIILIYMFIKTYLFNLYWLSMVIHYAMYQCKQLYKVLSINLFIYLFTFAMECCD